jgi:hypothetical protein
MREGFSLSSAPGAAAAVRQIHKNREAVSLFLKYVFLHLLHWRPTSPRKGLCAAVCVLEVRINLSFCFLCMRFNKYVFPYSQR